MRSSAVCCLLALLAGAVIWATAAPSAVAGTVAWRSAQPAPPPGSPFTGPLGEPADLQFLAPNLGLMMVRNTGVGPFPSGLLVFDGAEWRQLSTVCGGSGGRIAFASPTEWWTTSAEQIRPNGPPITLCHFRDGAVVGSYAVPDADISNAYQFMNGAACTGPANCWFGGRVTGQPATGTFLLRWDGSALRRIAHPAARAVTDLQPYAGEILAGTSVGAAENDVVATQPPPERPVFTPETVDDLEPDGPRLLRELRGDGAINVLDWAPRAWDPADEVQDPGFETGLVDIRAMDADGRTLWVAGRGSLSAIRPRLPSEPLFDLVETFPDALTPDDSQRPFLAIRRAGETRPTEVEWDAASDIRATEFVHDIAAIPGTNQAWMALGSSFAVQADSDVASLAWVEVDADGTGTVLERIDIKRADLEVGDAARVECATATDCWMVTGAGWLYRWSDPGLAITRNTDPAIQRLITTRPPDARTPRDDPDTLPADEAAVYVAPAVEQDAPVEAVAPKQIAALFRVLGKPRVRKRKGRYVIEIRIQLRRNARIQLVGRRKGKTVARTKTRTLKRGRHTIRLNVKRKRWPTALRFVTRDLEITQPADDPDDTGGGAEDIITTG